MFHKLNGRISRWMAISVILSGAFCSCASRTGLRPSDIRSSEDSIILGRVRFLTGASCTGSFQLPTFELRNVTERKHTSFAPRWIKGEMYQRIEIPISLKVQPGTYELRIKVAEGPPQSVWIQPGWLTLVAFEVPKGLLVYFGTVEIDLSCAGFQKDGAARYEKDSRRDEFELEIQLFQQESPQVYEIYKNRIIHAEPQEHWKKL